MPSTPSLSVAVLIATRNRDALLKCRSLPSIAAQSLAPDLVVLINDGDSCEQALRVAVTTTAANLEVVVLPNTRTHGVAGAWNTGLSYLWARGHRGFVAILDDDDQWDPDHLRLNAAAAANEEANVAVSGLRMFVAGIEQPRPFIRDLRDRDFLVGNPGWQGSNTFVSLPLLLKIGGFRDGLQSLNDRDLAVRLLRHCSVRCVLTERWTATWYRDTPGNLSAPGALSKLRGLRWFWQIYGAEMTTSERWAFFSRAECLFGFSNHAISDDTMDNPPHRRAQGDLHGAADE